MIASQDGLVAHGISRHYGTIRALDGVSLTVAAGECVAVVGESGSGKTTLLRCFNRLVEPSTGSITIFGDEALAIDPVALRRRMGYVPQDGGLLPHWRVLANAALVPTLRGDPDPDALARTALSAAGLDPDEYGDRWPSQLSGGQRQRVAVARAIAGRPDVVLLDEPFGALDAISRADLQQMFLDLRSEIDLTALLVTHDLHTATLLADRVAVMRQGKIEQVATPESLLHNPASEYVANLLHRARLQ